MLASQIAKSSLGLLTTSISRIPHSLGVKLLFLGPKKLPRRPCVTEKSLPAEGAIGELWTSRLSKLLIRSIPLRGSGSWSFPALRDCAFFSRKRSCRSFEDGLDPLLISGFDMSLLYPRFKDAGRLSIIESLVVMIDRSVKPLEKGWLVWFFVGIVGAETANFEE